MKENGRCCFCLVTGGAASGKSEYAEQLIMQLADKYREQLIYLATMKPEGEEAAERIVRHRRNREGRGFRTVEQACDLEKLSGLEGTAVLLEDMGNLLGNELFLPEGKGVQAVLAGIRHLREQAGSLVVVTNEIFSDGNVYTEETLTYMKEMAGVNCLLAAEADLVAEVICGIPQIRKGRQVW